MTEGGAPTYKKTTEELDNIYSQPKTAKQKLTTRERRNNTYQQNGVNASPHALFHIAATQHTIKYQQNKKDNTSLIRMCRVKTIQIPD